MVCRACGKNDVIVSVEQEQLGSTTNTVTLAKYKKTGHGCLWWLCVGWWWWIVDLMLWVCLFPLRLVLRLFSAPFKKKEYSGASASSAMTTNRVAYKKVFVCKNCGYSWKEDI
ncbi:hypothetical protein AALA99_13700 [Anaerotruncus colihominis]|uniref:hypothetical protein n=1 Tax=Anaerotruncus colihominis TaxID=169435 RepID=UPI003519CE29